MDGALGTDVGPAGEAIVGDLFFRVLLAIVDDFLGRDSGGNVALGVDWLLCLLLPWGLGIVGASLGRRSILAGQFDD